MLFFKPTCRRQPFYDHFIQIIIAVITNCVTSAYKTFCVSIRTSNTGTVHMLDIPLLTQPNSQKQYFLNFAQALIFAKRNYFCLCVME